MGADGRLAAGCALLGQLEAQGCTHAVHLAVAPDAGGLGVFASRDVAADELVMRCPMAAVLRADADAELSAALTEFSARAELHIDARVRLQLLLLHERRRLSRQPSPSTWGLYIASLPSDDLVDALPISWSEADLQRRAKGTALVAQVTTARAQLDALCRAVASHGQILGETASALDRRALLWAHAIFWSRALVLDAPGGRAECLVPLLDMCNHRPGGTAQLRVAGGCFELRAGRSLRRGEEVCIDYGSKGNGELLRCHGFVMADNPADVCPLPLARLAPAGLTPAQTEDRLRRVGALRLPERAFLFRGGLPERMLGTARVLCVSGADDLRAAEAAAAGRPAGADQGAGDLPQGGEAEREEGGKAEGEAAPFDWGSVDWTSEDPFGECAGGGGDPSPVSAAGERETLTAVLRLVRQSAGDIPAPTPSEERRMAAVRAGGGGGVESRGGAGQADLAALVYRESQRGVLDEAAQRLARRLEAIVDAGQPLPAAAGEARLQRGSKRVGEGEAQSGVTKACRHRKTA
jgi:hypothetical protein